MINKHISSLEERVQKIHKESVVIDALGGLGFLYSDILAGGINATHVTLCARNYEGLGYVLDQITRYYSLIEMAAPDRVMLVEEAQDILKAKREGKLGIIFGFQEGSILGENKTLLPILHKLGVRIIQLTYNEANLLGCGSLEPNDTGLTSLGIQVINAMNRLGIVVDLSHLGYRTNRDAIEVSEDPVVFTHANPLALKNVPRNKPDELIRMVAEKGGVMGLTPYAPFCKSTPGKRPTLEDFLDQIDYVIQLVGIDHVGIGTDKFEGRMAEEQYIKHPPRDPKKIETPWGEQSYVEGFSHISQFSRITAGLLKRGYSDEDCAKIIGGNFHSVFQKVWKKPGF